MELLSEHGCFGGSQRFHRHESAENVRRHAGYDHGYYFIASVVDDHLRHHAAQLL